MNDVAGRRLRAQGLTGEGFASAVEAVRSLGCVQSQDYGGARWALALRTGTTAAEIDRRFDEGAILRTHVLRPTWHFVSPADIRWMLALTAPRVNALSAYYYRQLDLDAKIGLLPQLGGAQAFFPVDRVASRSDARRSGIVAVAVSE